VDLKTSDGLTEFGTSAMRFLLALTRSGYGENDVHSPFSPLTLDLETFPVDLPLNG